MRILLIILAIVLIGIIVVLILAGLVCVYIVYVVAKSRVNAMKERQEFFGPDAITSQKPFQAGFLKIYPNWIESKGKRFNWDQIEDVKIQVNRKVHSAACVTYLVILEISIDICEEPLRFINEDPLRELAPYLDAANIDIKAMTNEFYKKVCGGRLDPVLETCLRARELGIHIELTYLIIPGHNDSAEELGKFCDWVVAHLGDEVPIHFSAFHGNGRSGPSRQ